jgi:Nuclear transport factor 2 (NTF2) domain
VLPPTIGFDVESDIKLPVARASFLCDPNGAEIVRQFLEQYFLIFDSGNRQPLLDAYHEHAMFSMTANPTQHPVNQTRYVGGGITSKFLSIKIFGNLKPTVLKVL